MSQYSPGQSIAEPALGVHTPAGARPALIWTAWIGTLLLSKLPLVIARDVFGGDISWILPAWLVMAALLIAATFAWPAIRSLRGYFILMGAILVVGFWLVPLIAGSAWWNALLPSLREMSGTFKDRLLLLLITLTVLAVLFLLGVKRRDAFLTVGNLAAPVGGRGTPAARQPKVTWAILGPVAALGLGALFFWFMSSQNPAVSANASLIIPWLPLILVTATINAFGEEVSYRAGPISLLLPAVGPRHALWMTSLWFGLGHYYGGIPSGPFGLVQTGLLALLMGSAMLDTRGLGWSWFIHLVADTVIYIFLVATMVAGA